MIRILLPLVLCCAHLALNAAPASSRSSRHRPLAAPDGQRFLFIVETSSGTGRIQAETEAALFNLIASGVNQEMRPGDTYGVWTFGKQLTAGDFPLQIWDSRNAQQLGTIAAAYLSDREFEKSPDAANMMSTLKTVIHSVSNLNIFIISRGDPPIKGTPFDKAINAEYKARKSERNKAGKPFVTALIVRDGWIIDSSVVIAGAPIKLPQRPVPTLAEKKPVSPTPVAPAPAPHRAAPLSQPATTPEAAPVAAVTPPAPAPKPKVMQIVTTTNSVATPLTSPPEVVTSAPAAAPTVAASAPESPLAPVADVASTISPTAPSSASPPPAALAHQMPQATSPAEASRESDNEPLPLESALAALLPKPLEASAREPVSAVEASSPVAAPAVQASALPAAVGVQSGLMFAFGALLLGSAVFLIVLVLRRPRPAPQGSLITQSMNQR